SRWTRIGVLSSEADSSAPLLTQLKETGYFETMDEGKGQFLQDFAYVTGARGDEGDMDELLATLPDLPVENKKAALEEFSRALDQFEQEVTADLQKRQ